jgi:hypothetical protein
LNLKVGGEIGMIKIGQVVEITSCEKTEIFCGRRSQYKIGDQFVVKNILPSGPCRG